MVRILTSIKDRYSVEYYLCDYPLYDLISAFCTEIITEPKGYEYLWYKIHYQNLLKEELKKEVEPRINRHKFIF